MDLKLYARNSLMHFNLDILKLSHSYLIITQPACHCKLKKRVSLLNFATNFLLFQLFSTKRVAKTYVDQHLECAAPNCWSKYTTVGDFKYVLTLGQTVQA